MIPILSRSIPLLTGLNIGFRGEFFLQMDAMCFDLAALSLYLRSRSEVITMSPAQSHTTLPRGAEEQGERNGLWRSQERNSQFEFLKSRRKRLPVKSEESDL